MFIGLAYLVIAIIGGLVLMKIKGDTFSFRGEHFKTAQWGFLAGSLGAAGALCLTTAMLTSRGNALLVMPIVFGGAVSITAVVSVLQHREETAGPWLWVGILGMAVCIVLVAYNTPHPHPPKKSAQSESASPGAESEAAH